MRPSGSEPSATPNVPWSDVVRFVRQLSHDLRNHLNAVELQTAYLGEIATDPEVQSEIKRLRQMTSGLGATLQKVSSSLGQPNLTLMPYRAADFVEDVRGKLADSFPEKAPTVQWNVESGEATPEIDPQLLQEALLELFSNAFRHQTAGQTIQVGARTEGDTFVFTLRERKEGFDLPTENWGREPLRSMTQGHYGLGLSRARTIVEAHGGHLKAQYDPTSAILATTVVLPLSGKRT